MAKHTPVPWRIQLDDDEEPTEAYIRAVEADDELVAIVYSQANARLIARAPSMLALLEKAYPIIEEEAQRRDFVKPERHGDSPQLTEAEYSYYAEMRELANEIQAEITKAKGDSVINAELCPHGYGFVEYCEDCNQKEIKAKWREKEDSHG